MRKYDLHLHMVKPDSDPVHLLARLDKAGLYGSNVISVPPMQSPIILQHHSAAAVVSPRIWFLELNSSELTQMLDVPISTAAGIK